jgi:predicted NBD/HSP70 family sugar kinase
MGPQDGSIVRSGTTSASDLLQLISSGQATTRAGLASVTGLARSTVSQRVDALIASHLVYEAGGGTSTGGRPPVVLAFNRTAGLVLAADLGATHCRLAVADLGAHLIEETTDDLEIAKGPDHVLSWVADRFEELLARCGRSAADVRGIGIGVPGPVDFHTGQAVNPPIMPGWDGVSIPARLQARFDTPVLVDNDVNIMALGEWSTTWPEVDHLLLIKVGTGIGCGVVSRGQVHRGADGAAGDIGHIRLSGHDDAICRCGNLACVEAVAGGAALAQQLRADGFDARSSRDVVRLATEGNAVAVRRVRAAGRLIGEVLASLVNFFNPNVVVVGGDLAEVRDQLLAGIREVVYQRSLPLATRRLQIAQSTLGDRAGAVGAAVMAVERALSPEAVEEALLSVPQGRAGASRK